MKSVSWLIDWHLFFSKSGVDAGFVFDKLVTVPQANAALPRCATSSAWWRVYLKRRKRKKRWGWCSGNGFVSG